MSAKKKTPDAHPKPFDPNATPIRVIVDVLWHNNSRAVLKGPVTSQALKTMVVQRERISLMMSSTHKTCQSWTHSLLREGYGKDKHWVLLGLPSRDSA